jgi:hypothetical protein
LFWWNGSSLIQVRNNSNQAVLADASGNAALTISNSTVPNIGQLGGTYFLAGQPQVTANTATLPRTSPTLTINGLGFDPTAANNTVTLNDGATGTVTAATDTQLTVTFTTPPAAAGSLTAQVSTDGLPSAAAVQVATVVASPADSDVFYVLSLYRTVLGRAGDTGGVTSWAHQLQIGATRQQVAQGIWESPEHRGQEVDQDYATYLNRTADPAGRAAWVQAFESGATENQVALGFLTSSEYLLQHASAAAFVNGLYADVLGRTGDAAGLASWMSQAQTLQGELLTANDFLSAAERNTQVLERYYADFLGRAPDTTGEQTWLFQLGNGGTRSSVAESILASDEIFARASVDL